MNAKAVDVAVLLLRLVLGGILVVAGALKVGHFAELAQQIAAFRILPEPVIAPLAVLLPFLEIAVGGCLIAGLFTRPAAIVATALLFLFDVAIASAVVRGMTLNCGCFGPNDKSVTTWTEVARDAIFVALALAVALRPPGALALDRRMEKLS